MDSQTTSQKIMHDGPHRVIRQVLELNISHADRAIELQELAAQLFQQQGLAVMESVFDRIAQPAQYMRIERLEIDLGECQGSDWRQQFNRRLAERLQQELEQLQERSNQTTPAQLSCQPFEESLFQQFLFFCQHGRLPWWGSQPVGQWHELQSEMTSGQWRSLAQLLSRDARAMQRLIYIADDQFLQILPQTLVGIAESAQVQRLLMPDHSSSQAQQWWRERFWLTVLGCVTTTVSPDGAKLLQQLLVERQNILNLDLNFDRHSADLGGSGSIADPTWGAGNLPHLPDPWQTWLDRVQSAKPASKSDGLSIAMVSDSQTSSFQQSPLSTSSPTGHTSEEPTTADSELSLAKPEAILQVNQQGFSSTPSRQTLDLDGVESVYGDGAGIVILHPFLQELFSSLDLLNDQQFYDQQTQRRAVALLSYLTYGDANAPEYTLLIPKLLCAWPWEEPLPPCELTETAYDACEVLLGAVLNHWSALRSSSSDWLRQQFFLRDGKLKPVDFGWHLTVERRVQDVLLDRLPWGMGLIHLPWMTDFLHVSWT